MNRHLGLVFGGALAALAMTTIVMVARDWPATAARDVPSATLARAEPARIPCGPGLDPVAGACVAVPAGRAEAPLVVYLHGLYDASTEQEELDRQSRVARLAAARGYATLAVRGRADVCTTPAHVGKYCWPSNDKNAERGPELVATLAPGLAAVEARMHVAKRYVLGFSNGGYFAALIAADALLPNDGLAVAHAGPAIAVFANRAPRPMLLLTTDDDAAQDEAARLARILAAAGVPFDAYARAGAHALLDADIETALAFFARVGEGAAVPLDPPLDARRVELVARPAP